VLSTPDQKEMCEYTYVQVEIHTYIYISICKCITIWTMWPLRSYFYK